MDWLGGCIKSGRKLVLKRDCSSSVISSVKKGLIGHQRRKMRTIRTTRGRLIVSSGKRNLLRGHRVGAFTSSSTRRCSTTSSTRSKGGGGTTWNNNCHHICSNISTRRVRQTRLVNSAHGGGIIIQGGGVIVVR